MLYNYLRMRNWLRRDEGQDLAEYALLIGLIALVCYLAVSFLGEQISALFVDLAGLDVDGEPDPLVGVRVGIVGGRHGENHENVKLLSRNLRLRVKPLEKLARAPVVPVERLEDFREIGPVAEIEVHVTRVAGGGVPRFAVLHRVDDGGTRR